jgi:hypothetical protein
MCIGYSPSAACPVSATSTIPENQQRFATSALAYGSGVTLTPTTSPTSLLNQIPKPIATSTSGTAHPNGITYWGIAVPGSISLAGSYTGQNTFTGAISAPGVW